MANPDDFMFEYAVIRYVPRVDREEFINVGLLMMSKRRRWMRAAVHLDERRLRAFDPRCDLEALRRQLQLFERSGVPHRDSPVEERYRWLTAAKSAVLQTSASHPGFAPAPAGGADCSRQEAVSVLDKEFDRLLRDIVM